MIRAAIAGVGFMGWIHYLAYQRTERAQLVGFCSRNAAKRAGDWTSIQGNFGPPGEQIDVSQMSVYESLDEILDDPSINLVDLCLPPNVHADAACKALAAGKHVLCEKPLALNTEDCDRILEAAEKAGRKVMVAQVLPFMGEFAHAFDCANQGTYGKPSRGYFKRVISPPDWIPNFYDSSEVGGPLIDLHVHDTHFVRMLYGMPSRVMCLGEMKNGLVKYCNTLMQFSDPGLVVATTSGVSDQNARPFCHGFEIQFEQAVMQYELSAQTEGADIMPLKVLGQDGKAVSPELPQNDEVAAFQSEIECAVESIESGEVDPRLDGVNARDAIHICQCLQQSAETGEWVNC